jgi:cyclic pyranopterin phosphate synthase
MPSDGIEFKSHDQMLRYEDIAKIALEAGKIGFYKIRLTGGEPLVKKNIEHCVALIKATGYYRDICMTTNGSLLTYGKAVALKTAGLDRVTISLDTLDSETFTRITRGGIVADVIRGIDAAQSAGFANTKINMVITRETTPEEIDEIRSFCQSKGTKLQLIHRFTLLDREDISINDITAERPPKCNKCNRIRITADGFVKSCLFSDNEEKIDLDDIAGSLKRAIRNKPENGVACSTRSMNQIGG